MRPHQVLLRLMTFMLMMAAWTDASSTSDPPETGSPATDPTGFDPSKAEPTSGSRDSSTSDGSAGLQPSTVSITFLLAIIPFLLYAAGNLRP